MFETEPPPLSTRGLLALARHWPPTIRGRARLRAAIRSSLRGREPWLPAKLRDSALEIIVPWNDHLGSELLAFGDNEPHVHRFLRGCFAGNRDGLNIFVDIGANVGAFALRIAERFTDSRVIAFEPNPPIAALLRFNAERTGLASRVDVRAIAAGAAATTAFLNVHETDSGNATLRPGSGADISVPIRRLDTELSPEEWRNVAVVKIDVEGHEMDVLRGATDLFKVALPPIIFEVNCPELAARGLRPADLGMFLRSVGYQHLYGCEQYGLYPMTNGAYPVANAVALGDRHDDIVAALGFDPTFKPPPRHLLEVVQYQL